MNKERAFHEPKFEYIALVQQVYDADTITCDIDLGFGIIFKGQKIRLYGIDAPEVRGKEREYGLKARDYVRQEILSKYIRLHTFQDRKGKYGRWLGIIETPNCKNFNEKLVELGYAENVEY